jgi:hypothetical protein
MISLDLSAKWRLHTVPDPLSIFTSVVSVNLVASGNKYADTHKKIMGLFRNSAIQCPMTNDRFGQIFGNMNTDCYSNVSTRCTQDLCGKFNNLLNYKTVNTAI